MNSPSSGQHTAHYSPVIIAPFVAWGRRGSLPLFFWSGGREGYAIEVRVLTPEDITVSMLVQGEREPGEINEIDQFVERLKKNELTFQYQKQSQQSKVKMANLHVSNCHSCNGFALWVSGRRLL